MKFQRNSGLAETLERLNQRIEQLEQSIQQMSKPVIEHVTIERVYVQNPVLERLEFGLDNLDIKELSGALNLGNNFGVSVEKPPNGRKVPESRKEHEHQKDVKEVSSKQKQNQSTKQEQSNHFGMEKTESGYLFKVKP